MTKQLKRPLEIMNANEIGPTLRQTSEVRTVAAEGLAKLLLSGRVVSHKLLSRLLLLWYNPITEDDTHLRHCLGAFFTVFAFSNKLEPTFDRVNACILSCECSIRVLHIGNQTFLFGTERIRK